MEGPNPLHALFGIVRSLVTTDPPRPTGTDEVDHSRLKSVLDALASGGLEAARETQGELEDYLTQMTEVAPDSLSRSHALAFWVNLYNAGAIQLALEAADKAVDSVLRVPGAFQRPRMTVAGEELSLNDIEHGKVRRLGDPRIHAGLVCGSLSCPTLRSTPYSGGGIDAELHDQMRVFLESGGAIVTEGGALALSRIFLWYGADFVRPHRMPTFLPASKSSIRDALLPWLPNDVPKASPVEFQSYDWALACEVG